MFQPEVGLPAAGRLLFYRARHDAPLADVDALGLREHADVCTVHLAVVVDGVVRVVPQQVAAVAVGAAVPVLVGGDIRQRFPAPSGQVYARAARLAIGLVAEHQIAPTLRRLDDRVVASWRALLPVGSTAADTLTALADALPGAGHALPADAEHQDPGPAGANAVWHPHSLLRAFVDAVVDALARDVVMADLAAADWLRADRASHPQADVVRMRAGGRPRARLLPWTARWQEALTDAIDPTVPLGVERGQIVAGVGEWLRPFERLATEHTPELALHAPRDPAHQWSIDFAVRDRQDRRIAAAHLWRDDDGHSDHVEALLEALARAARLFPPIERALDQRHPDTARFDTAAAWQFIDQVAPLLREAGYHIVLPEDLDELRARVQLGTPGDDADAPPAQVAVTWQGAVADAVLDDATVNDLLEQSAPLVFYDGRWLRISDETRRQWAHRGRSIGHVPLIEGLGMAMAGNVTGFANTDPTSVTSVTAVGPLAGLVDRIRRAEGVEAVDVPTTFAGDLRPYQRDAVSWLAMMAQLRLGGVLADDMGLGKTIMLIVHLLRLGGGPHLVVCPTSVVANWERELTRFAPSLPHRRHHGPDRPDALDGVTGVVVTSYGTLRRDIDLLSTVDWHVVALDEAQQVKNPDTLGARAVRRLRARHTVALTGTPVENRLRELWSVLDLTNPGLLGARARFERRFANPIERRGDSTARTQLRRMIAPFVLRRTKSDPRVAPDLPPRIERTVPCTLTDLQRRRYAAAVAAFRARAEGAQSDMQYRGTVLALLTRLKQICDHPTLGAVDGHHRGGRSGKLDVTRQLVTEATAAGEQVLVFTQFVQMARLLVDDLSHALQTDLPILHGQMSATARQRVVDRFSGAGDDDPPPVLIASLRAGGVGMNLTAATQVIHYDRWWNPAVEDQASDRAHRIGQTERVLIHRLVTMGTLEERIDAMLAGKREIADAVVGAGETWITELAVDQLLELVALSDDDATLVTGGRR